MMDAKTLPSTRDEAWRWSDLSALPGLAEARPSGRPHAIDDVWIDVPGPRLLFVDGAYDASRSDPGPVRIGAADALLIAFDQTADYDSQNFLWFRRRFDRFVYVDRVVVDPARRGMGLARRLYAEVFARASAAGHGHVVCEVNSDPPNPASDAFHAALGFREVGAAIVAESGKAVRYYERDLATRDSGGSPVDR